MPPSVSAQSAHEFNEHNRPKDVVVPSVVDQTKGGERAWDIYSSLMKGANIIWLTSEVNDQNCELLKAELMYLDAQPKADENGNTKPIVIYIDSPGGSVHSGLSVVDVMQQIKTPVATIVAGMAASMGSVIAAAGAPGLRYALPNAEVMVHQPSSGSRGKETDMRITYKGILDCRNRLEALYTCWMGLDTDSREDLTLVSELLEHRRISPKTRPKRSFSTSKWSKTSSNSTRFPAPTASNACWPTLPGNTATIAA
jgi:ATP-dependent Clp protease protease subunit